MPHPACAWNDLPTYPCIRNFRPILTHSEVLVRLTNGVECLHTRMSSRTFTLDEAQDLLPVLESLLRTGIEGKQVIESVEAEFHALQQQIHLRGGMSLNVVHLASRRAQREKALQRVKDAMAEIDAMGVQVKDLDMGLLDFPCEVDGQLILLCWKLGEKTITHWHGVSEGFAGRKPVDERITRARKTH